MATSHEIVGQEWHDRARELAEWAMQRLVNRKDVWGQYSVLTPSEQKTQGRSYKAMTLPRKDMRGDDMVTLDKLTRHFASRRHRKPQLIGLHAKSKEHTSRWLGIDIDCHDTESVGAEDHARRNLVGAISWWRQLQDQGYDPVLMDSSGRGGYHLWILFAEPAPTEDVFAFAQSIVTTWETNNLDEEPETFPKRLKRDSIGSWFRLPGLHHTHDHYTRIYSGDEWLTEPWLEGHAAIDALTSVLPGPPPPQAKGNDGGDDLIEVAPKTEVLSPAKKATNRKRSFKRTGRATVCVDLDGVLAVRDYSGSLLEIGEPVDGAIEFCRDLSEFADILVLTSRLSGQGDAGRKREKLEQRIRDWLDEQGFDYSDVWTGRGKPPAHAYIDDRGVACRPEDDGPGAFTAAQQAVRRLCDEV